MNTPLRNTIKPTIIEEGIGKRYASHLPILVIQSLLLALSAFASTPLFGQLDSLVIWKERVDMDWGGMIGKDVDTMSNLIPFEGRNEGFVFNRTFANLNGYALANQPIFATESNHVIKAVVIDYLMTEYDKMASDFIRLYGVPEIIRDNQGFSIFFWRGNTITLIFQPAIFKGEKVARLGVIKSN
jgi:hypothetical protein